MRRAYIHEGRVLRNQKQWGRAALWTFVEWKRVACLMLPAILLWVTNPANRVPWFGGKSLSDVFPRSAKPSWLVGRPRTTNYGLFSLDESIEGVTLSACLSRWEICAFGDASVGGLCGNLADAMCHRKPLLPWEYHTRAGNGLHSSNNNIVHGSGGDGITSYYATAVRNFGAALAEDRVFVAHRILCSVLLLSAAFQFCCPRFPASGQILGVSIPVPFAWIQEAVASVLWNSTGGTLLRDLVFQTTAVYPALQELDRMLPRLRFSSWLVRPTGQESLDYALAVAALVIGIGGGSNALAGLMVGSNSQYRRYGSLVGFSAAAAAAMGYAIRATTAQGRLYIHAYYFPLASGDREVGLVQIYWTYAAWIFIGGTPRGWYSRLVVWLLAGLGGSLYAEFHLSHVELSVVRDLLGFFGLA